MNDLTYERIQDFVREQHARMAVPTDDVVRIELDVDRPDDEPLMVPGQPEQAGTLMLNRADLYDLRRRLGEEHVLKL